MADAVRSRPFTKTRLIDHRRRPHHVEMDAVPKRPPLRRVPNPERWVAPTAISSENPMRRPASSAPAISDGASNHAIVTPSTPRQSFPGVRMPAPHPSGFGEIHRIDTRPGGADAAMQASIRSRNPCSQVASRTYVR
jgi:hypothetical protein